MQLLNQSKFCLEWIPHPSQRLALKRCSERRRNQLLLCINWWSLNWQPVHSADSNLRNFISLRKSHRPYRPIGQLAKTKFSPIRHRRLLIFRISLSPYYKVEFNQTLCKFTTMRNRHCSWRRSWNLWMIKRVLCKTLYEHVKTYWKNSLNRKVWI